MEIPPAFFFWLTPAEGLLGASLYPGDGTQIAPIFYDSKPPCLALNDSALIFRNEDRYFCCVFTSFQDCLTGMPELAF